MDIAAGNGEANGPAGIAPDADLIFVHLADRNTGGLANFGDSVRLLEAVRLYLPNGRAAALRHQHQRRPAVRSPGRHHAG